MGSSIIEPSRKYRNLYISLAFIAVAVRVATVIYLYQNGTDTFGTDGLLYHRAGIWVAKQLAEGVPFYSVKYPYTWYTAFVGIAYHIFGINRYVISYINIALTFLSSVLLLKIALNLKYKCSNAIFISLVFLYFPNLFLWTADSRKEALLIFLCFLCLYSVQRFMLSIEDGRLNRPAVWARIIFVCFLLWLSTLVRIYMFVPLAAFTVFSQFMFFLKTRKRIIVYFAVAVIVSSIIILFATVLPLLDNYHAMTFPDETGDLSEDIGNKMDTVMFYASGRNILTAAFNYIILPYPGDIDFSYVNENNAIRLFVSVDMIAWYLCLLLMPAGIFSAVKKRNGFLSGVLIFLLSYIFINILVVENVSDTIYRYRSVILGMALLFIDWRSLGSLVNRLKTLTGKSRSKTSNV